jgi:hypothetical protein
MAKFSELTRKQRLRYFQEIKEGERLPTENIILSNLIIVPPGETLETFITEKDLNANFLKGRTLIVMPSNGREVLRDETGEYILE